MIDLVQLIPPRGHDPFVDRAKPLVGLLQQRENRRRLKRPFKLPGDGLGIQAEAVGTAQQQLERIEQRLIGAGELEIVDTLPDVVRRVRDLGELTQFHLDLTARNAKRLGHEPGHITDVGEHPGVHRLPEKTIGGLIELPKNMPQTQSERAVRVLQEIPLGIILDGLLGVVPPRLDGVAQLIRLPPDCNTKNLLRFRVHHDDIGFRQPVPVEIHQTVGFEEKNGAAEIVDPLRLVDAGCLVNLDIRGRHPVSHEFGGSPVTGKISRRFH